MGTEKSIFSIQLPEGWRATIDEAAARDHLYAADIVRQAIAAHLNLDPPPPPAKSAPAKHRRHLRISIEPDVHDALNAYCKHEGRSQGRIVEQALREYFGKGHA